MCKQARPLFAVTVSDHLRLLRFAANKVIETIDFSAVLGALSGCLFSAPVTPGPRAVFVLLGVLFHVEGG